MKWLLIAVVYVLFFVAFAAFQVGEPRGSAPFGLSVVPAVLLFLGIPLMLGYLAGKKA